MKRLFLFLLLAGVLSACSTQKRVLDTGTEFQTTYRWQRAIAPASLAFASGVSTGLHETVTHHYDRFEGRYPGANAQFWDPRVSWRNKYKQGDSAAGPAYLGSTTFLVATTDAYHLTNLVSRGTLFAAGCTITLGERRPWWHYAADIGISYLAHGAGFHGVYSLWFRK